MPEPDLQGPEGAIVRPLVVATCDLDAGIVGGQAPFPGPFPFGHEFVAEVLTVGDDVLAFRPGDRVIVPFQISCGRCDRCRRGLTSSCTSVPARSMYGLGPIGGEWGGALSDAVAVPFADAMLVALPSGMDLLSVASLSDNIPDGFRTVAGPLEDHPGATVLILGGAGGSSVPLYAAGIAVALGAIRVDFVDTDPDRLAIAEKLGATAIEGPPERRYGPYPITVDSSADPAGLASALRSTEAGGVCTSTGIYYTPETPIPLLEMYGTGVTLITGRANARADIPSVLELVATGRFHPDLVTSSVVRWDEAAEALSTLGSKVVVSRDASA